MKNAIEWFKEKGFSFDDKITIKDVMDLQNDARKDGLMTAIGLASDTIRIESPKYSTGQSCEGIDGQNSLSGLQFKVSIAILKEADTLKYLPKQKLAHPSAGQGGFWSELKS